jgi:hypothetical protein
MERADMMMKKLGFTVSNLTDGKIRNREESVSVSFIYGIGIEGLSQFEQAISTLNPGESIEVELKAAHLGSYFGPLYRTLCGPARLSEPSGLVTLRFTLASCASAEPKEIVAALAAQQKEGGCSSNCGCGCGGH